LNNSLKINRIVKQLTQTLRNPTGFATFLFGKKCVPLLSKTKYQGYEICRCKERYSIKMEKEDYELSVHLLEKIAKGKVELENVETTLSTPDKIVEVEEDEVHFFKKILNFGSRCFKVVFNPTKKLVVTAYFDRKMTKNNCK